MSPVSGCPHTAQQQAQRGEGDCPGSHSKIVPERAQTSQMFGGLPDGQVGGRRPNPALPVHSCGALRMFLYIPN